MSILNEWLPTGTIKAHWWQMETQLSRINGIRNFMFNFVWVWLKRDYTKYIYLWCKNTLIVYYMEEWESGLFQRSWKPPLQWWGRRFESGLLRQIYKFQKNLLYLLRFCYVFVCLKIHTATTKAKNDNMITFFESCYI